MPINRFSTVGQSEYTPQHVPLPFEAIGALGEKITKEHEAKQAEADALANELNKIKVVNEVISEGAGDDLGIKSRSTGYGDFKNQVINKYTQANKQLADEYQSGKLDANQFSQRVSQLKSDFGGDYQKLKIAEANSAAIEEADKKYREAKHAGANPFVLNELAAEGSRLRANPYSVQYKGAPISDVADLEGLKNKYAEGFKSQVFSEGAGRTDKFGNIIYTDRSGVHRDRIINSVASTFDNDPVLGSQTKEQTNRFLRDRGLDWDSEIALKDGTKVKAGDYYYNSLKEDFISGVVSKAESSDLSKQVKKNWLYERSLNEKLAEDSVKLIGNALPGSQVDVLSKDPEAQDLLGKGIIKVNSDGTVDLDRNAVLAEKGKTFTVKDSEGKTYNFASQQEASTFVKNMTEEAGMKFTGITQKPNSDLDIKIDNFMVKAAKVAGFSPQQLSDARLGKTVNAKGEKISWSSMSQNILTAYNQLTKVRMGGVQLPSSIQEVESSRVSASPSSYDVYDPITHVAIPNTINKGDKVLVGERVYVDGQAFDKTTIQSGTSDKPITKTVLLKPKSLERNDYFDRGVASTQNAILDMTITGGDMPTNKLAKHIQGYDPNLTGDAKKEQDSKLFHVTKDFDDDNDPLTPGVKTKVSVFANGILSNENNEKVSYYFIKNDNNLQQQTYVLNTPQGKLTFNDYSKFLTHADAAYYLYGQGKNDATAMKNKRLYEQMLSSATKSSDSED